MADEPKLPIPKPSDREALEAELKPILGLFRVAGGEFSDDENKKIESIKNRILDNAEPFRHGNEDERKTAKKEFDKIKDDVLEFLKPKLPFDISYEVNENYKTLIDKYELQNTKEREQLTQQKLPSFIARIKEVLTEKDGQAKTGDINDKLKKLEGADQNADGKLTLEEFIKTLPKLGDGNSKFKEALKAASPDGYIKTDAFKEALTQAIGVLPVPKLPTQAKIASDVPAR